MLDAAPSPECDIALLLFHPAFSSEIKGENTVFLRIFSVEGGVVGQHRVLEVPVLLMMLQQHKLLQVTLGTATPARCGLCPLLFIFKKFFHSDFQRGAPSDVALQWRCSVTFCLLFFLLFLSVLVCLVLPPAETKRPLWLQPRRAKYFE